MILVVFHIYSDDNITHLRSANTKNCEQTSFHLGVYQNNIFWNQKGFQNAMLMCKAIGTASDGNENEMLRH